MKDTPVPIDDLPALPRDKDGPVFSQPWEAKAFALAVRLSEAGFFTWPEWVRIFSREIKAAQERGDPDLGDTYYQHWLNALERICAAKDLVGSEDMRRPQGKLATRLSQHAPRPTRRPFSCFQAWAEERVAFTPSIKN